MPAVSTHLVAVARSLTGSRAAALVAPGTDGGRSRVLAATGDDAVRSIALAALHAGHPEGDEMVVIDVASLPAVAVDGSGSLACAAVVPVNEAVLVVACDSFGERSRRVLAAVAGQGGLALRNAQLLAGHAVADVAS